MRRMALLVTAALALAACGGSPSRGSGPPPSPTGAGADEVVVRVVTEGAFLAETRRPDHLPKLSVFGDGRGVVIGPTTLQYPGPALPNLQEFRVTPDGLARVLDAARGAGLLDDNPPDYGQPGITDQATTTVTVRADGATRRAEAYALGFKGRVSGVTPEQSENRRRLEQFIEQVGDPDTLRDDVVPGSERRYDPAALAVLVRPSEATDDDTHPWPLGDLAGTGCTVVTGDDLGILLDAARDAREGDPWSSGNATYLLTFRPLLPDERTCDDFAR